MYNISRYYSGREAGFQDRTDKVFTEMTGADLLEVVLKEIVHMAGRYFADIYGFLPATQSKVSGLKRLDYFLQRLLAPHVAMLEDYLGDIKLEELFPKDEPVRFKELCKRLKIPAWKTFSDELAYLRYHLPCAERIFAAAFKGYPEAQQVMAKMYFDEDYLPRCDQYRWRWKCYSLGIEIDGIIQSKELPDFKKTEVMQRWAVVMALQAVDEELWSMAMDKYFADDKEK